MYSIFSPSHRNEVMAAVQEYIRTCPIKSSQFPDGPVLSEGGASQTPTLQDSSVKSTSTIFSPKEGLIASLPILQPVLSSPAPVDNLFQAPSIFKSSPMEMPGAALCQPTATPQQKTYLTKALSPLATPARNLPVRFNWKMSMQSSKLSSTISGNPTIKPSSI